MNSKLTKKLRVRFVLYAMLALVLLQSLIVGVSIFQSYRDMIEKSDTILTQLQHNSAAGVRYFSVKVHPGKGSVRPDVMQQVSLTPQEAASYAREALDSGEDRGFVGEYRYRVLRSGEGICILFLSRSASLEMLRTAAVNLAVISAVGLTAVCLILIPVSALVVRPIAENDQKQKQFITMASHELKTPLTVISTNAQLLETEIGENRWITGILEQVSHLDRMTGQLVTLAKAQQSAQPEKEQVCVNALVEKVLEEYAGIAKQKDITLTCSMEQPVSCNANRAELLQLLRILLDNSFKYCPKGGQIRIQLAPKRSNLLLSLSNTCEDLDPREVTSLSQQFVRGQNTTGKEGFGLGLSIAQAITEHHTGQFAVSLSQDAMFMVEVTLRI